METVTYTHDSDIQIIESSNTGFDNEIQIISSSVLSCGIVFAVRWVTYLITQVAALKNLRITANYLVAGMVHIYKRDTPDFTYICYR